MGRVLLLLALAVSGGQAHAEFCSINITTAPPGAQVFLDGKLMGLSPLTYMHGHPVALRVKLVKKGYETWDREVSIGMSEILGHHIVLKPLKGTTR